MKRKRAFISAGLFICLTAIVGGAVFSLQHQPAFYQAALSRDVPPEVRKQEAKRFVQTTLELVDEIKHEDRWAQEFSEESVNSWLAEELPVRYTDWLPPEVKAPRVKFEKDLVRVAFQTRYGAWEGVVSGKLRGWVAGPNQLCIEIQGISAGLVPIPVDEVLHELVSQMTTAGWRMEWKHVAGKDLLVVEFADPSADAGRTDRPVLEAIEVQPALLRVAGRRGTELAGRGTGDQQ